jgi:hypothetical protein
VETLLSAPVASELEDMPTDFITSSLDALNETHIAVGAVRHITDIVNKYLDIDNTLSVVVPRNTDLPHTIDTPANKRIKNVNHYQSIDG